MAENKRMIITLPLTLLEDLNLIIDAEKKNRSEIIREAVRFYLTEKRKLRLREEMRNGYQEMSVINLSLCDEAFCCEEEVQIFLEQKLWSVADGN